MSGHNKWSKIKRQKAVTDAKRSKSWARIARDIMIAAREGGGDPYMNARLALAVDKAKAENMPKDNIERAIAKGTGSGDSVSFEEVTYEGYGPGGTAILLEVLTDNRNRAVGEVRHLLAKYGGNLGANGCVSYLFEKKGLLTFERSGLDADSLLEAALDAGAEDVRESADTLEVVTTPQTFEAVKGVLTRRGFSPGHAAISMEASSSVSLGGKEAEAMLKLADELDDLDDVQNVYANFDISDDEMARLA
jgi:YebC/PmpR family DNA-binding regulatory protein